MKPEEKIKKIEKVVMKIAIEIAKHGEGALFVIGDKVDYSRLIKQKFGKLNVFDQGAEKILKGLAVIDGAVIINRKGNLVDYGAMIRKSKPFVGYGTRHSAGISASRKNNIAILASEEERKVKIFKDGKYIMQIDALQKNVEKKVSTITKILESTGAGVFGTIGTATLVPAIGISLIPGIIVFGGSYFAVKSLIEKYVK